MTSKRFQYEEYYTDELRDMVSNYSIPTDRDIRGNTGIKFGTSWNNFINQTHWYPISTVIGGMGGGMGHTTSPGLYTQYWSGSTTSGALSQHCSNFTSLSGTGTYANGYSVYNQGQSEGCNLQYKVLCICF